MDLTLNKRGWLSLAVLGASLASVPEARVFGDTTAYGIFKTESFLQSASAGANPLGGFPYTFVVQGSGTGSLTLPSGTKISLPQAGVSTNNSGLLTGGFASESSLEATYPNGSYTLSLSGLPTLTYSVGSPLYPASVPQVNGATWQNGVLVVNPGVANTLNFSTFKEYATAGVAGHMQFQVQSSSSSDNVSLKQQYATVAVNGSTQSATPFTSYTIPAGTLTAGLPYECTLSFDTVGSIDTTSIPGGLSVLLYQNSVTFFMVASSTPAVPAPTITTNPSNQTAPLGGSATFTVGVSFGSSPQPNNTSWIWVFDGQELDLSGQKYVLGQNGSLTVNNVASTDLGTYSVIVLTGGGQATSTGATLSIGTGSAATPPAFTTQPASQVISSGSSVVFNAAASGTPTPTYQWYFNNGPLADGNGISGSATSSLVISGATTANAGSYYCVATNSAGSLQSNSAGLSLTSTPDVGRLINISCRAQVGTGGNILIAGFVIGGAGTSGSEPVLIRGTGPALVPFGVTGTLPDPQLQIYSGSTVVGTNDGWGGSSVITNEDSAVGAFALTNTSSHDAALVETLQSGAFTAQVSGQSGDTGVALVEVYDATPAGTFTQTSPHLINISTRVQVGTGGNILIAGFVIGGSTSETLLIRASGPALVPFGVTGTLPDPQLQLYSGSTLLGTSNGWFGNLAISNAASEVGAFSWSNPASHDSAILVTLPPGAYTAQVSGASGDTGVALIEVYEVP